MTSAFDLQELGGITQDDLNSKPWKHIGYKGFTTFASSSSDFLALRRFDRLHTRTLLVLQARISALETELDRIDDQLSRKDADDIDNGTLCDDASEDRVQVQKQITDTLDIYTTILCHYLKLKGKPKAPSPTIRNIKRWLANRNDPIDPTEVEFLDKNDLISIEPVEKPFFRKAFDRNFILPIARALHRRKPHIDPTLLSHRTTVFLDDDPDEAISVFIFLLAILMLVAPLWVLSRLTNPDAKLGVITAFVVSFLAVLNWGTAARAYETLAATAGYSAVLVVFLQLGSSSSGST